MVTTRITYNDSTLKEVTFPLFQGVETQEGYCAQVAVFDEETVMFSWENDTEDGHSCVELDLHAKEQVSVETNCLEYAYEHIIAALWGDPNEIQIEYSPDIFSTYVIIHQTYRIEGVEGYVAQTITIPTNELEALK